MLVISERKVMCKNNLHALSCIRILVDEMDESISSMINLLLNLLNVCFWKFNLNLIFGEHAN